MTKARNLSPHDARIWTALDAVVAKFSEPAGFAQTFNDELAAVVIRLVNEVGAEMEALYYAVLLDDDVMMVTEVATFAEAVENKNALQAKYNKLHGCDAIFHMREANLDGTIGASSPRPCRKGA
jgi:hypothetical protein